MKKLFTSFFIFTFVFVNLRANQSENPLDANINNSIYNVPTRNIIASANVLVRMVELEISNPEYKNNKEILNAFKPIIECKNKFDPNKFSTGVKSIISLADKYGIMAYYTAFIYEHAITVEQDINKAEKYYLSSVETMGELSVFTLCRLYFKYGNDIDIDNAIELCNEGAKKSESNKAHFQGILGEYLTESKLDTKKGFELLCDSLKNKELPLTHVSLALAYSEGLGVKINQKKAVEHLERAVEKFSDTRAKVILSGMYLAGMGTPDNKSKIKEAEKLAKEAYEAGESDALYILMKINPKYAEENR